MFNTKLFPGVVIALLALSTAQSGFAQQSSGPGLQQRLGELFSTPKEEQLLEPDDAFKLKVSVKGPTTIIAEVTPANGYYLYKNRIRFAIKNANGVAIKTVALPAGEIKNDQFFGRMETYKKPVLAEITLERSAKAKGLILTASYQGCHEKAGVCYPPIDKSVNLTLL